MTYPNRHARRAARHRPPEPEPRTHRFVVGWAEASRSARPDREVAVLEAILVNTWSDESLRSSWWISHATTEVYLHCPGSGFGPARTLGLIGRFLDFLRAKGKLDAWSHKYLRHEVERQRIAHRLIEGPAPSAGHDEGVGGYELERVAASFAETLTHPIDREIGASVVSLVAMLLSAQQDRTTFTRFGALDVAQLVHFLAVDAPEDERSAAPAFLRILADFYAWRGAEGGLDPARATELATQLRAAALAHGALRFAG